MTSSPASNPTGNESNDEEVLAPATPGAETLGVSPDVDDRSDTEKTEYN